MNKASPLYIAIVVLVLAVAAYVGVMAYKDYMANRPTPMQARGVPVSSRTYDATPETMPYGSKASTPSDAGPIVDSLISSGLATKITKFGGDMTKVWVTAKFRDLPREERIKIARAINFMKGGTVLFYDPSDTHGATEIGKLWDATKRLEWPGE